VAFLGVDSLVPGRGAFSNTEESAAIIRALAGAAARRVVVMEHAKLGRPGCFRGLDTAEIDMLITDSGLDTAGRRQLETEPYTVLFAE
jgi:DeoR/GlpR family transcriptional regulator of sugar metabolism